MIIHLHISLIDRPQLWPYLSLEQGQCGVNRGGPDHERLFVVFIVKLMFASHDLMVRFRFNAAQVLLRLDLQLDLNLCC